MNSSTRQLFQQLRAARGIAPTERIPAVRSTIRKLVHRARRRAKTAPVRVVEITVGPSWANRLFWSTPGVTRHWYDVAQRIGNLQRRHPSALPHFVGLTLRRTISPVVVAGLAQRPQTAEHVAEWLRAQLDGLHPSLVRRIASTPMLAGAVLGATARLLDADQAAQLEALILDATTSLDLRIFDFAASMGYRPSQDATPRFEGNQTEATRSTHRAVIARDLDEPDAYAVHFRGADRVSVLATVETFGQFDVTPYLTWPGVGDVRVEHIRTRTPRFSTRYIDLHLATAHIARAIVRNLGPYRNLIQPSDLPVLEVEVADWLFFRAMRLNAVEVLLEDTTIDHVVVALGNGRAASDFVHLLSGSVRLRNDRRVEFVSASHSEADRVRFLPTVDLIRHPVTLRRPPVRGTPDGVRRYVQRRVDVAARSLDPGARTDQAQLLFVTTNNTAYNDSTAAYIDAVAGEFDVRCVHSGRNASDLMMHLQQRSPAAAATPIEFLVQPADEAAGALADALHSHLFPVLDRQTFADDDQLPAAERFAAWAARSGLGRMCRDLLAPSILRLATCQRWFEELRARDTLPDAVVITPQRAPATHAFAPLARRFGVPSLTVEPHAQDANYSRYIKISSDYYGVMSDYFRHNTAQGFDMPIERIRTLGSPRQIRPPHYDRAAEQALARRSFTESHDRSWPRGTVLAFFCQPSDWEHVEKVWRIVLEGAARSGSTVLLKPHPEESVSRVRQYLDAAAEAGLDDQVILLAFCDAETTVALADIVATGYSAAALDAAIRGVPVVCVTYAGLRYPVDIPAIVDAPLVDHADDLATILKEFDADPRPFQDRARRLLERESQFVTGPGERLRAFLGEILDRGSDGIRTDDELPPSLFLDPPHPVFPV